MKGMEDFLNLMRREGTARLASLVHMIRHISFNTYDVELISRR